MVDEIKNSYLEKHESPEGLETVSTCPALFLVPEQLRISTDFDISINQQMTPTEIFQLDFVGHGRCRDYHLGVELLLQPEVDINKILMLILLP